MKLKKVRSTPYPRHMNILNVYYNEWAAKPRKLHYMNDIDIVRWIKSSGTHINHRDLPNNFKYQMSERINSMNNKKHFREIPLSLAGSLSEWASSNILLEAYENNINTISEECVWMLPLGETLSQFIQKNFARYNSINENYAMLFFDWGFAYTTASNYRLTVTFIGPGEKIVEQIKKIDSQYKRMESESTIEWYYQKGPSVASISIPLNYKKAYDSFYPYIGKPIKQYFTDYLNADESVLILIGPPGTGKTSFIRNMLHETHSSAIVTYDKALMASDSVFVEFVSNDGCNFLIAEDADTFLGERGDGNDFMFKFLNISDGLISTKHKKLIFSTNLNSTSNIDKALLRKGRCFDVLHFRPLNRAEAELAAKDANKEFSMDGSEFTLTEIFNGKDREQEKTFGFRMGG